MRKKILSIFSLFVTGTLIAQPNWAENLRRETLKKMETAKDDVTRFNLTSDLFNSYIWSFPDSAAAFARQSMLLAQKIKSDEVLAIAYQQNADLTLITGSYPKALEYAFESLKFAERTGQIRLIIPIYGMLSELYGLQNDYDRCLMYALKQKKIFEANFTPSFEPLTNPEAMKGYMYVLTALSRAYERSNRLDSALKYIQIVERGAKLLKQSWAFVPFALGNVYSRMQEYSKAIGYYRMARDTATQNNSRKDLMEICYGMAKAFKLMNELDSSIAYANQVIDVGRSTSYLIAKLDALNLLAELYKKTGPVDSAAKYFELALLTKDSIFNQEKSVQMQNLTFDEQARQQKIEDAKREVKKRITIYSLIGGLILSLVIILLLNHNRRQKQKANTKIEKAYAELKSTQAQLIQSEKMASLGELTAGIAHEIQNPLNFVNNFSEVSDELVDEMKEQLAIGNKQQAIEIADDIKQNLDKINQHGKRADAIVKGMLQHSQKSSGQKEPTDINALCEEYLRLAYHGFRSKNKNFNARLETHFDASIHSINVVTQELGRAILNVINNALYAVSEKKKQLGEGYEPTVNLSTTNGNDTVDIRVQDNGIGIPEKLIDKIFQPFFTTKPTGQGTGLGLSLAYDIVTKGHAGELKVETKEGEGTAFIIQLPNP